MPTIPSYNDQTQNGIDPFTGLTSKPKNPRGTTISREDYLSVSPVGQQVARGIDVGAHEKYVPHGDVFIDEGLQEARARGQGWGEKAFNGLVGGVASGVLTAVEDVAYTLDFGNNIKRMMGLEEVTSNFVADAMKELKMGLEEKMPIYRRNNEVFDWSDPGFYWSSIKGILDSAVGFGLPGIGASKVVGGVQKLARTQKYLNFLKTSKTGQQITNAIGAGYITNFGEGKMMGLELFENSMAAIEESMLQNKIREIQESQPDISPEALRQQAEEEITAELNADGGKERKRLEGIAGHEANQFMLKNKAMIISDAIGLHGLYKTGGVRNLMQKPGQLANRLTKLGADNMLVQAAKEGAEEVTQNILQMEGEFQARKEAGADITDAPLSLAKRVYQYGTSDKALLEGMMGVLGGGPQRIMTEALAGKYAPGAKAQREEQYAKQVANIAEQKKFLASRLGDYAEGQRIRRATIENGENDLTDTMEKFEFFKVAGDAFTNGTTAKLDEELARIEAGVTPEEVEENSWDPKTYQQLATKQRELLKGWESQYNKYSRYENQDKVFSNRMQLEIFESDRAVIQENIDKLEGDIESGSATPNPKNKTDLAYYQDRLVEVDNNISNLNKEYTHLISAKVQKEERDIEKARQKEQKDLITQLKAKVKKDKQERKAAERVEESKRQEGEEKIETAKEAGEDLTVTKPEPEVETVEAETVDEQGNVITTDDQAVKDAEQQVAEEGRADIKPPAHVEEEDDTELKEAESEAAQAFMADGSTLVEDFESGSEEVQESDSVRRLRKMESMVENYKKHVGRDDITFKELINALVKGLGVGPMEKHFGKFEALWSLTHEGYESVNYLSEFRRLTHNEKEEIGTAEGRGKAHDNGLFFDDTLEENEKENEELEGELNKGDQEEGIDGHTEIEYLKVKEASGIIAYLSRTFDQITRGTRRENSDKLNKEMLDKRILDAKIYPVGTKLRLVAEDNNNQDVYAEGRTDKQVVKWGAKKAIWDAEVAAGNMTKAQRQQRYEEQVPVAIYAGDIKIGYLHETEWINDTNVSGDIAQDKQRSRNIRKAVVAKGKKGHNTEIANRTNGYMFKTQDGKKRTLSEAMPEKGLTILIGSKGQFKSDRNKIYSEPLLNKSAPREGVSYVVVPVGDSFIALPLDNKKFEKGSAAVNAMMRAVEIFMLQKDEQEDKEFVEYVRKKTGHLITTNNGLESFLEMYVNSYKIGKTTDLQDFLFKVPNHTSKKNNFYVSAHSRKSGDLYLQVSQGDGVHGYSYISRDIVAQKSEAYVLLRLKEIRESLEKTYTSISLDSMNTNVEIVRLDSSNKPTSVSYEEYIRSMTETKYLGHNVGTDEKPNWVYSIQPVITMDLGDIDGSQKILDNAEKEEVTGEEATADFKEEEAIRERWIQATVDYVREQTPASQEDIAPFFEDRTDISEEDKAQIREGLKEQDEQFQAELDAVGKRRVEADKKAPVKEGKKKIKLKKRKGKYTRGNGKIDDKDIESGSAQMNENELFRQILAEYSAKDVAPERKSELQEILFNMYYAEGEMISFEEKRNQARRKMGKDDIESQSAEPLKQEELDQMLAWAVARFEDGKLTGVIVEPLGATKQQHLVDFLRGEIVKKLVAHPKAKVGTTYAKFQKDFEKTKAELQSDLAIDKENLQTVTEQGGDSEQIAEQQTLIDEGEAAIAEMDLILDNWDVVTAIVDQEIERIDSIKKVRFDEDEEQSEEEQEEASANEAYSDSHYENDPSDSLAVQLKQFFSNIGLYDVDVNGKPIASRTYWGDKRTMSYQDVYNILQSLTPNQKPDFELMMKKLEEIANDPDKLKTYPFMLDLVTKLRKASKQIQNQFVTGMTNHDIDMRFIMFERVDGETKLSEYISNANAQALVVQNRWYGNLIASGATAQTGRGEVIIEKSNRDRLFATWQKWQESKVYPPAEMRQWLQEIGISLSDETFNDLMDGEIEHAGDKLTLDGHVRFDGGLFRVLAHNIKTRGSTSLTTGDRLIEEGVVKSLAKHEAEYDIYAIGNSHRTGDRTVYSYGQNKFLVNRVRDLKDFTDGKNPLLEQLSNLPFNKKSLWIEMLKENGGKNEFHDNFSRWLFSLEPLQKKGTKAKKNAELQKLSARDIELAKIGMLQASRKDQSAGNNRIIQILYPTASDKTTVMGLTVLAADIDLDASGNITDESVQVLFDRIVRSEIRRIHHIQDKLKTQKEGEIDVNLEAYEEGAQQFLFFPEINKIPDIFNENGTLNGDIESDEFVKVIKDKIEEYFNNLVDEKMVMWTENEIVGEKENHLNSDFLNVRQNNTKGSKTQKNPLAAVETNSRIRGAASDMVFQYLIGNAEIAMTMNGDPALFFKQAGKNRNTSRNDKAYDFVADAEETYANIGKRLAADIAPGYELADAYKNNYVQGFLADRKSQSLVAMLNTQLLDGDEGVKLVKEQLAKGLKGRKLMDAIGHLKSAPYYAIEGADAQEYTTWKEHLYVMKQSGELSDQDYNDAHFLLSHNKPLTHELLGKVMQPMKPVFVDNIIDTNIGVEKRVYIKSSSFPLLPQLTANNDLENLRIAMENGGIDRVAFGTAVKAGNVAKDNQLNIFDDNGNIIPADQISFLNSSMTLNRKGFRIQQPVPYDAYKVHINKLSQAAKNLFINMLEVEDFKYKGETKTGAELQKIYHSYYDELHQIELKKLLNEVTVNGEGELLDKIKLRKTLLKEAMTRNYPISDQELMHIDKELGFLAYSPSADKYESLLTSIVTNRVIRLKMPGTSGVLASEEGFNTKRLTDEEAVQKTNEKGIIHTDNWTGELLPARPGKDKDGNDIMLPAQAIVPWKFTDSKIKDKKGRRLKIENYTKTDEKGVVTIDFDKIPEDVLKLFGMRIPNQGPNSQSAIEIVGFLPEASGDLIVATKDYVVQMGSDFDVDKLYMYMYNVYARRDGKLRKQQVRVEGDDTLNSLVLQNQIIDIHMAIHANANSKVQSQIAFPLGFWILKDLSKDVENWKRDRAGTEEKEAESVIDFKGGFDPRGKGTQQGDGKDKAMRQAADMFIGETARDKTTGSTQTSAKEIAEKHGSKLHPTSIQEGDYAENHDSIFTSNPDLKEKEDLVVMLARNGKLKGTPLTNNAKHQINVGHESGARFIVGDMIDVDSQFIEYLQEIGATFTIYHDGSESRITIKPVSKRKMFTGLSDEYQRNKFKNATAGKDGVSSFSVDSMFNAVAQGKALRYTVKNEQGEGRKPLYLKIGNETSHGEMSNVFAMDKETYISDIIAGYQSAAVDNEKEQILDKLNINTHTFKAIKILNQLGFTKETPLLMAQDILFEYVKEIERLSSTVGSYVPNKQETAKENVLKKAKYTITEDEQKKISSQDYRSTLTPKKLEDMIKRGSKSDNYAVTQHTILDLFLELDQLGLDLQSLQSTINSDSKGLGKSVIESQIKEEQVIDLIMGGSPIENAEKTIGDVIKTTREKAREYEDNGYHLFYGADTVFAFKPTTVNGFAIEYGLFTANKLWSELFPYRQDGVTGMFNYVDTILGGDTNQSQSRKAESRREVWLALKSFRYADKDLGLYEKESNVSQERLRLIYDVWEKEEEVTPDGVFEKDIKVKESLASFVRMVQQTNIGKTNTFLASLETVVQKNGDPSTVRYRASLAEQSNEVHLYIAILQLLKENKTLIGEDGQPLLFNGEQYTSRQLMQDLILYSYITGGIQEAVQFVKYIPAAYLKSIPFADKLSNTVMTNQSLGLPPTPRNASEKIAYIYSNPPVFEQYVQHKPEKVPSVNEASMRSFRGKSWEEAVEFTLTDEAVKKTGFHIPSANRDNHPAPYVSIRKGNSSSGFRLYRYSYKTDKYSQIDTLGAHGNSEYGGNDGVFFGEQQTLIPRNKASIDPQVGERPMGSANPLTVPHPQEGVKEEKTPETEAKASSFVDNVLNKDFSKPEQGREAAMNILNQIVIDSKTPYHTILADELVKHVDQLPMDIKFIVSGLMGKNGASYGYGSQELKIFPNVITDGNPANLNKENINRLVLHEIVHGLTGYKVLYYEEILHHGPRQEDAQKILDAVDPKFAEKWTKKDEAAVKSIRILMKQVKAAIDKDPTLRKEFDNKGDIESAYGPGQSSLTKDYGLTNTFEFISEALTNHKFQEMLNKIDAPSGKTFWQALKERLAKLFANIIGVEIREGSVLEAAIHHSFELISNDQIKDAVPQGTQVEVSDKQYTRESVENDPGTMYIFTDNANRTSGTGTIDPNSWYAKKYGADNKHPSVTSALIRGLGNAYPISTMERKGVNWTDATFEEFKMVIDDEIAEIKAATHYDKIRIGNFRIGQGGKYAKLPAQHQSYLDMKLLELGIDNTQTIPTPTLTQPVVEKKETTEYFMEHGTAYKFVHDEKGGMVSAQYDQSGNGKWMPLNLKRRYAKYLSLKEAAKLKGKEGEMKIVKEVKPELMAEDNQLLLPNGKMIKFNEQQADALTAINEWLETPDSLFFTLSGFAGTGKTTIILKTLETTLRDKRVAVSAPTHKAKKVVGRTTKRKAETIHALLALKPNVGAEDFNPNNLEFARDRKKRPKIGGFNVVIIDEASMLNKTLMAEIVKQAIENNTRVLFMGDKGQIPPIGENQSDSFDTEMISHTAHLDMVERQDDGNPLFKTYDAIRKDQTTFNDQFDHVTDMNEKKEGIFFTPYDNVFVDQMIKAFTSEEFKTDKDYVKTIAYTNDKVKEYNSIIRQAVMGTGISYMEKGDFLTGYTTIADGPLMLLENSADYIVTDVSELETNRFGIEGKWITFKEADSGSQMPTRMFVVSNNVSEMEKVATELEKLVVKAKKELKTKGGRAWLPYYAYKEANLLLGNVLYPNGEIRASKSIDYGYAITAHKSQGSTYTSVFVDEDSIDTNQYSYNRHHTKRVAKGLTPQTKKDVDTERNKIKYVAFSRPSKNAVILSQKTGDAGNTHVDKPVVTPPDPNLPDIPPGDVRDDMGDGTGEVIASFSREPANKIVPDKDVIALMNQCK